jgi:translation initiation factor IF-1
MRKFILAFLLFTSFIFAQTNTDVFVMFGSDFVRPGLAPKANYNIGIGHTEGFLKKNPLGDELTFAYTYENGGSHGFLHTEYGSHTEALGLMKNFSLPKTKRVTGYTWIQGGVTSMTGDSHVKNRLYNGESLGAIIHLKKNTSIWIQETWNKVVTVPWYTSTSIGFTKSF